MEYINLKKNSEKLKKDSTTKKIVSIDPTQLQANSEDHYGEIVDKIYKLSEDSLQLQLDDKKILRKGFFSIFRPFLIIQFIAIIALIVLNGFNVLWVDKTVLTVLVSAMFVETLGAMTVMIKYCFDSKQEVKLLEVLNGIVANFQKFKIYNKDDSDSSKK